MQMHMIADALRKLPATTASQFKVVFVTTDPVRDTPLVLRSYLDHFDRRFIGRTAPFLATGRLAATCAALMASSLPVRPDGNHNYEVGHSAFVLAYTKDNLAHVIYPSGLKLEDWVNDLPLLAAESWTTP